MRTLLSCIGLVLLAARVGGQPVAPADHDSFSLNRLFTGGQLHGQFRLFGMATDNAPGLSDYHAVALGGALRYSTRPWRGFSMNLGGRVVEDLTSSNFTVPDSLTSQYSRYDAGLYELLELDHKTFLARLEDFNAQYRRGGFTVVFGKQVLKTPWVNPQDGRMAPNYFEGVYGYYDRPAAPGAGKKAAWHVEGGWLYQAAPRSTTRWFRLDESVGVYPQGVTPDGKRSDYYGKIRSAGLFLAGAQWDNRAGRFQLWDYFLENTLHTVHAQWEHAASLTPGHKLLGGLQFVGQHAVGHGGSADPAHRYVAAGHRAIAVGAYAGWQNAAGLTLRLNATHITADGRLTFPREWGRDPLFTFLQRERNEGLGRVSAATVNAEYGPAGHRLAWSVGLGTYRLPDVRDYRLNKYGLPSYHQLNLEARYRFSGPFDGLGLTALVVYKKNSGDWYGEPRYRINKVDMANYNLIFNYKF